MNPLREMIHLQVKPSSIHPKQKRTNCPHAVQTMLSMPFHHFPQSQLSHRTQTAVQTKKQKHFPTKENPKVTKDPTKSKLQSLMKNSKDSIDVQSDHL
jgi:hypothetical protein